MKLFKFIFFLTFFSFNVFSQEDRIFDRGPDSNDPMQRELVQILSELPYVPGISKELQVLVPEYKKGQKMRPDFGAMPLRGLLEKNSVSVLVIGQDGTHIAEAANRPGIAGFGGRVQDMLKHFGVYDGVLFTNLYVNTISGQYGSRNTPVIKNGEKVEYVNLIENRQWLMTHEGAYGEWRNKLINWIIRNNKDSLKMVMMLGQAGKDAGANFINSIGGKVSARSHIKDGSQYDVPLFKMVSAGGNNEWAVPLTKDGKDVAEELRKIPRIQKKLKLKLSKELKKSQLLRKKLVEKNLASNPDLKNLIKNYLDAKNFYARKKTMKILRNSNKEVAQVVVKEQLLNLRILKLNEKLDYKDGLVEGGVSVDNARALLEDNPIEAKRLMVFSKGGPANNGVLYPHQFGGWDLSTMKVNGKETRSIKGLKLPYFEDGVIKYIEAPDAVFVGAPHPTSLSMGSKENATSRVEKELINPLKKEYERGWNPPKAEKGYKSSFPDGPYKYGRAVIPTSHGDAGIPKIRLLPVSTAQRSGANSIIIGTRDSAVFDKSKEKLIAKDTPSNKSLLKSKQVLTGRTQNLNDLFKYDRGPSKKYAKLLFQSLKEEEMFLPKHPYLDKFESKLDNNFINLPLDKRVAEFDKAASFIFSEYGIGAFNTMTNLDVGFYGHYRGTFKNPKVIILADPHGYDSIITSKAATGERGQFLHGLMKDLGVGNDYLIINTVPFGMDDANPEEWKIVLEKSKKYRENILNELLKDGSPSLILSDGKYASKELNRIIGDSYLNIERTKDFKSDMKNVGRKIKGISQYKNKNISGKRIDIPREHLTWIARVWEGTSGDRVLMAQGSNKGKAFKIIVPDWARKNKVQFSSKTKKSLDLLLKKLVVNGEPRPMETIPSFLKRNKNRLLKFIDCNDFLR